MLEIAVGIMMFTAIIVSLVLLILIARHWLVPQRIVDIEVNEQTTLHATTGVKLLAALADNQLFLASACGGGGTCGQCQVKITRGAGTILPTEKAHITKREADIGMRLACQVTLRENVKIEVPPSVFGVKKYHCKVRSNKNIATFIKEVVLELPEDTALTFKAGGYVQVECPPYHLRFSEFDIGEVYRAEWDHLNLWRFESASKGGVSRAYSMANYPSENTIIMLNVRIATPPPKYPSLPPGVVSSYIFNLKPGDEVSVAGPFGAFFAKQTDAEMIFVGAGAGMAPMRSHIFDQLKRIHSQRKISFWYGARSLKEMPYIDDFNSLSDEHLNFSWYAALSQALPGDHWNGYTGYIHEVLLQNYLIDHAAPEDCEYYLCGPPMMTTATITMLENLGVEQENILLDDFGG